MLFSPLLLWVVLVPQNQQNVCFPSKGWLSWLTVNISQVILRQQSATACSCGGRNLTILACCCCSLPSTSSAAGLTGKVTQEGLCPFSGLREPQWAWLIVLGWDVWANTGNSHFFRIFLPLGCFVCYLWWWFNNAVVFWLCYID